MQNIVERIVNYNFAFDREEAHRIVDIIIENDADVIGHIVFDQVAEAHRQRVERRIAFMVHPDKNTHNNATDAF